MVIYGAAFWGAMLAGDGTSDFGMNEKKNVVDVIEKIRNEAKEYLVTAPLGYNK